MESKYTPSSLQLSKSTTIDNHLPPLRRSTTPRSSNQLSFRLLLCSSFSFSPPLSQQCRLGRSSSQHHPAIESYHFLEEAHHHPSTKLTQTTKEAHRHPHWAMWTTMDSTELLLRFNLRYATVIHLRLQSSSKITL